MRIHLRALGMSTTIQDEGRSLLAALGVPRAGAVDRAMFRSANLRVGNAPSAAAFETRGGLVVVASYPVVIASSNMVECRVLHKGEAIEINPAVDQQWAYLAIQGGIDVAPVLGSRGHDTENGIGPLDLLQGAMFKIGTSVDASIAPDPVAQTAVPRALKVWPGPHTDLLNGAMGALTGQPWTAIKVGNRDAVEFGGVSAGLLRPDTTAPQPHAVVEGALQLTRENTIRVALSNHPTLSDLPIVGVVGPGDIAGIAQATLHSTIEFVAIGDGRT